MFEAQAILLGRKIASATALAAAPALLDDVTSIVASPADEAAVRCTANQTLLDTDEIRSSVATVSHRLTLRHPMFRLQLCGPCLCTDTHMHVQNSGEESDCLTALFERKFSCLIARIADALHMGNCMHIDISQ